jgi:RND superfamily putative drug exporter
VGILLLSTGRRMKWLVLAVFIAVALGLASQAGKINDVTTNDVASQLPKGAESLEALSASEQFSSDVSPALVVYHRDGRLTAQDRLRIAKDRRELNRNPVPLSLPVPAPRFSPSGDTALLTVPLRDEGNSDDLANAVEKLRERVSSGETVDGLEIATTGSAAFAADLSDVFSGLDTTLLMIAGGIVLLLLVLIYRSPFFWAIPFFIVVLTEMSSRGLGYLLGEAGLVITGASGGVLIVLVFGAATDYALLLVARYREELREHEDTHEAMRRAIRGAAPAILASGGTVIASLLTLFLARVQGTEAIGPLGAVGIALALVFSLTALPAALLVFGRPAFWPFIPRPGDTVSQNGFWARLAAFIPRRRRPLWIGAVAVLAVLGVGISGAHTDLTQEEQFTQEVEAVRGQELLSEGFPGGFSAPTTVIVKRPDQVPTVRRALAGDRDLVAAVGRVQTGPPGAQISVILAGNPFSAETVEQIPRLRDIVHEAAPGSLVGGQTAQSYDYRTAAERDNLVIPPVALAVVFVILVVLLRSLLAPLLLLATVVASFVAALGFGVFASNELFDFAGLDPSLPLLSFVFLVALGVDYNIFLATRAREESIKRGTRPGMLAALAVTGGVITAAGIVLAGTFATLAVLPLVVLTQLGVVVAFGVLLDTLLVRSILVPALFYDIGSRVWWPSRLGREEEPKP